jgi:hypothetical protein
MVFNLHRKYIFTKISALFDINDASFDVELYLALNPELVANSINPIEHWVNFGYKEQRIATKSAFSVDSSILGNRLDLILKNLEWKCSILKFLKIDEKMLFNVPWTLGCWGRPISLLVLKLTSNLPLFILRRLINFDWQISRIGFREFRIYIPLEKYPYDS